MTEQQPPKDPLRMFTLAGRILALATLLVVGGMFYWFVMFVNDKAERGILPSGHYSIAFLLIPGVIIAANPAMTLWLTVEDWETISSRPCYPSGSIRGRVSGLRSTSRCWLRLSVSVSTPQDGR